MHIDGDGGPEDTELPLFEEGPSESVDLELDEDDLGGNIEDYLEDDGEEEEVIEPEVEEAEEEESEEYEPEEAEAEDDLEAEEEEEEEEPRPRKRDAEKRIAELARRAQEAERRAQEIEARLQQEAALRQQSDIAMMTHYEQRLKGDAGMLRSQLQEAITMGDTEKQIDLQTRLLQVQQDLSGVDAWRKEAEANLIQLQERQAQPQAEPQQQQQQITLEPRTKDWIEKNTWFQPQSPDFDPELHEEATIYARRIERRYKADGRADEIGSASYFKEIDRHMREEFPDVFQGQSTPKKAAPKMKRDNTVAPVARSGGGEAAPVKRTAKVSLSPAERQFARNMNASGAYPKVSGRRMTDVEAEKYYATYVLKGKRG